MSDEELEIVDVWDYNFFEEMAKISALIPRYRYIAMDTEFPGVVNVPK
jgi:CCR4-NOT transcription complex subunit 7/8